MITGILLKTIVALTVPVLSATLLAQPLQTPALDFPQASPAASFKQRFGLTDVELEYSRPSAKGRKVFGALVPYGEVWRTGANSATKLTISSDVSIEGKSVPAGSYALFTIPGESEWTVILSKVTGTWGSYQYDAKDDHARIQVKPTAMANAMETMTIELGDLTSDSARLSIAWEKTRVAVQLKTDLVATMVPKIKAAMAAEGKKPCFQAAMFYYEQNLDLKQALTWIDTAIQEQPEAMWMIYRKGLIQAKAGDKAGALDSAKKSLEMASKAGGAIGSEYKRLSESLIASLK